ncbi:FtsK/SpoIIIE family DNA translocase [Clostridium tyrobutyricum]|jgi:S-DNA-T family DNA segregation ATPase FtsK/SpoIIIE|uniref:FtsK/SpoIIIE family DNA translocase n=1 Tax=Clostridium tyrobutyricum TaxID=1519 RepID=UPI00030C5830|nr:DNA translocase FtsK [Clostridium tyrobutyricum]MBR9647073.1 DNA translocase FtsK [Clostridium tyrobutyricum]MBV4414850.1 DNA translocase FtsK [Clostridium tyrobutyricum]MBV4420711.1 DNA translocase FtsK [Clostridium tyrobutyricum]MBV4423822.1 DNA translocase FtsK [Clostridium tyrobutyricum]MBV4426697.1 DNA translocase FtsK [Clostridium tyrobutyricum]
MTRKRRRKKVESSNSDIKGIILITFGILMLISVFSPSTSGIVGRNIKKILIMLMGLGAFIFPALIIFIGGCVLARKNKINFSKRFYGIILFTINTLLFIQMITMSDYYPYNSILDSIKSMYSLDNIVHGGIISLFIDIPLLKLFGDTGCYVIFLALYFISVIIMSKLTLYDVIHKIKDSISEENQDTIVEDRDSISKVKDIDEKEGFIKGLNNRIKILNFMKSKDEELLEDKKQEDKKIDTADNPDKKSKSLDHPIEIEIAADKVPDKSINEELNKKMIESEVQDLVYNYPEIDLLKQNIKSQLNKEDKKELINSANKLEETLNSFGVEAKVMQVSKGPSVTRFELQPSPGVKVSKIVNLSDDIALGLAATGVRIEAPIPGKSAIGIEVPNRILTPVYLREVVESKEFSNSKAKLAYCLGKDIGGNCIVSDLTKMPHLLIAGATGSGKSVCINTLVISLLYKYSPETVKLLMIDPKVVELSVYNGIPHLLIPVVTNPKKAAGALNWAVQEMNRRYKLFADTGVRNIEGYNKLADEQIVDSKLPFVVMIIDELADLMMVCPNEVEDYIGRLAQMARAAGMHLVIATQRPSVDVITGVIKANIPSRISFAVSSQIDSRTILDTSGAEKLLGKGDMLFYPVGEGKPVRIQGAFISEKEVENVVKYIRDKQGEAQYENKIIEEIDTSVSKNDEDCDELLNEAIRIVLDSGQASTSLIQRRLRVGYNRAARIIEQMEDRGIISGKDGTKPRQVLVNKDEFKL